MLYLHKLTFLLFVLINSFSFVFSQSTTKEEKHTLKKARKLLSNEKFADAQANYLRLIELDNKNVVYNFEGGLSYYFADFQRSKSVPLFEAALNNSLEDTIPELYYYLASAYHINGEFKKSKEAFIKFKPFIKKNTKSGQELLKKSEYYININNNGSKYLVNKNENTIIKNLGSTINSSFGEYAPVIKKEDQVLLFTSRRKNGNSNKVDKDLLPFEDVFVAKLVGGDWQLITDKNEIEKYVPKDLNTKKHDAGIIYSSDGNTLYTYKNDLIWKSILENGKWSKLVELDENINSSQYNIPSVNLSKDGNTIYFVSTRKDGYGGKDIYKSTKNKNGKWNVAENLGEKINTKFDEESPFITEDGNTIYFASKGHNGIGGFDIFKSTLTDAGWNDPKNMGIPINSSLDDIYLIIDEEEKNGYFSSARDGGMGGMDIYSYCLNCPTKVVNTINGLLVDNNEVPLDGAISLKLISSDSIIETSQANVGKFSLSTETTGNHVITVEAPNFEKQTVEIELPTSSSESDLKFKLYQYELGDYNYQVLNTTSNKLLLNRSDTLKLEKLIAIVNSNTNDSVLDNEVNTLSNKVIASYEEYFDYNIKEINTSNEQFKKLINKAFSKARSGNKIHINIESSASRVSTKSFNTNIRLSSERGKDTKKIIVKLINEKGIDKNNIIVNPIKSYVSGPRYSGDFNNIEKYKKYQYVKITIK